MRYLTLAEVLALHRRVIDAAGGAPGVRDLGMIESAVALPKATFDGHELYGDLVEKTAALAFALIRGHGFVDGNKRVAHAALEVFLVLNGHEIAAGVDEQESTFLALAAGSASREDLHAWLRRHVVAR